MWQCHPRGVSVEKVYTFAQGCWRRSFGLGRHGRAAAQQSSDDGESSGDESVSGVWELDVEELRGRLDAQPKLTPEPEIEDAEAAIADKAPRWARDAISANGCCQCFTVHMCLAVFVVATAGLLLTAVGAAGTAPHLTPSNVFQKLSHIHI